MNERKPITCNECSGEVRPGMLFCWRHRTSAPKVGELLEDHGQLIWRSTSKCSSKLERAVAVLLDGIQVQVRSADEVRHTRPARVSLEIANPSSAGAATTSVHVTLVALMDAFLSDEEQVDATRPT